MHGVTRETIRRLVVEHVAEYGRVPSNGEIARVVGISPPGVQHHLNELADRGVLSLRSEKNNGRAINTPAGRIARKITRILLTDGDPCDVAEAEGLPRWVGGVLLNLVKFA